MESNTNTNTIQITDDKIKKQIIRIIKLLDLDWNVSELTFDQLKTLSGSMRYSYDEYCSTHDGVCDFCGKSNLVYLSYFQNKMSLTGEYSIAGSECVKYLSKFFGEFELDLLMEDGSILLTDNASIRDRQLIATQNYVCGMLTDFFSELTLKYGVDFNRLLVMYKDNESFDIKDFLQNYASYFYDEFINDANEFEKYWSIISEYKVIKLKIRPSYYTNPDLLFELNAHYAYRGKLSLNNNTYNIVRCDIEDVRINKMKDVIQKVICPLCTKKQSEKIDDLFDLVDDYNTQADINCANQIELSLLMHDDLLRHNHSFSKLFNGSNYDYNDDGFLDLVFWFCSELDVFWTLWSGVHGMRPTEYDDHNHLSSINQVEQFIIKCLQPNSMQKQIIYDCFDILFD